jgi:hypothetical protein
MNFSFVVCRRTLDLVQFADDCRGTCCRCHAGIRFRPDVPKGPKVCFHCARAMVAGSNENEPDHEGKEPLSA